MNKIIYLDTLRDEINNSVPIDDPIRGTSVHERMRFISTRMEATTNEQLSAFPLYLSIVEKVNHNDKSSVYSVRHAYGTAKVTADVAAYLLTHAFKRQMRPQVYAAMEDGIVTGVALVFLSDKD